MAPEPGQRHPTAALVAKDLRRFATGRPILSRRTTPLRRAAKWVRRHKAPSAAIGAAALVVLLAVGLIWTIGTLRQREGQRLALDAYEQLAFLDYRQHELVADKLQRAAALGAASPTLQLAQALAALGAMDQPATISAARQVLAENPRDTRAAYLLAWAQQRAGNSAAAQAAFDAAEEHGPPDCAEAWCFRGLAMHTRDPARAIESYRAAIPTRARQHEFYPLAVLHLARARNQLMYESRGLDGFAEAEASLLQLVEHGHYDIYPYYLLSIAHCLAAEIYSGSSGTRGDDPAQRHHAADRTRASQPSPGPPQDTPRRRRGRQTTTPLPTREGSGEGHNALPGRRRGRVTTPGFRRPSLGHIRRPPVLRWVLRRYSNSASTAAQNPPRGVSP